MRYENFRYLWPPRPERKVHPDRVLSFQEKGWYAQAKLDGDCLVLGIAPNGAIQARTRHGPNEIPSRWSPGANLQAFAKRLPGTGWYVFVAELMDKPARGVLDTVFLHELLVDDGEYLVGHSCRDRQDRLATICGEGDGPWTHTTVMPGVWLARNHTVGFDRLVGQCSGIAEGLVFKNRDAPLSLCVSPTSNAAWQSKCRVTNPHVSY